MLTHWPSPTEFLLFLGIMLWFVGLYIAALPIGECGADRCTHCRNERLKRAGKLPPDA